MLINGQIREREVRVLDEDGAQLGIMSGRDALAVAEEKNLDLVLISPTAKPPVCKIMNYGKFKYETVKKEKENKKNNLIDRGAVHPEPCGMCLWKDGGSIRYPGTTGGSGRADPGG